MELRMIESNDQEWGLCDHYLVAQDLDDDTEEDYGDEDDESPWEHLARVAADIEAGAPRCREAGNSTGQAQTSWCGPPRRAGATPPL
jgi:hypothetical protein